MPSSSTASTRPGYRPGLRCTTPTGPASPAFHRAFVGRSDRATPPAALAGDQPARPASLQRANLTGLPHRRRRTPARAAIPAAQSVADNQKATVRFGQRRLVSSATDTA